MFSISWSFFGLDGVIVLLLARVRMICVSSNNSSSFTILRVHFGLDDLVPSVVRHGGMKRLKMTDTWRKSWSRPEAERLPSERR